MFVTNAEARETMATPVQDRTPEQQARLNTWLSIEPEYDRDEDFYDRDED